MVDFANFESWYRGIFKNKSQNTYAPHKPLTLIFTLTKALQGVRWIDYNLHRTELEDFIGRFTNRKPNCLYPLWRLKNDSKTLPYWEVSSNLPTNASGDVSISDAISTKFRAGFSDEVYRWLTQNRALTQLLIDEIIADNFSETLAEEIVESSGLGDIVPEIVTTTITSKITRQKRDPNFPKLVMQAYDYRCCFCQLKIYQHQKPFPMQAAHIKWKAQGGDCDVVNGLSLCPTHHYTFDKGVWTLDYDYNIVLSKQVLFDAKNDAFFTPYDGKSVRRSVLDVGLLPSRENIDWHKTNIFYA